MSVLGDRSTPERTGPGMTIAIPTYNRASLLRKSLASAVEQNYENLRILVLDNASTDETETVVRGFGDDRIEYVRNGSNIGIVGNWKRAVDLSKTPYVSILQDDDELHPQFVSECVDALESSPSAAFSFTHVRFIDAEQHLLYRQPVPPSVKAGMISGREFLLRIAAGDNWVIHTSSAVMKKSALDDVGSFDTSHSKHAIEFNLYFRLAEKYDLVFVPKELVSVRHHSEQNHITSTAGTGPLAMISERLDASIYLLRTPEAADPDFRNWLADRLLHMSLERSQFTSYLLPNLNVDWAEQESNAIQSITTVVPEGGTFIMIDDWSIDPAVLGRRDCRYITDEGGEICGSPVAGDSAVDSVERLRREGAGYLVVVWPAFWWFDYYAELREYLNSSCKCTLRNSSVIIYELIEQSVREAARY
ncbi:MAG: glycosyltransferase [Rhodothermia bacterium]|nr:glycosyltransferase [Rhodothermia bacterium]